MHPAAAPARSRAVLRALTNSVGVAFVVLVSTFVQSPAGMSLDVHPGAGVTRSHGGADHASSPWQAAWSERYPGCVSVLLWPADERPVALVTKAGDDVDRVPVDGSGAVPWRTPGTVGACR